MALDNTVGGGAADTYATVAETKEHWDSIGFPWDGVYTDIAIEQALRRTVIWLDGYYTKRWPGKPVNTTQARAWPRSDACDVYNNTIPSDSIPQAVKLAQMDAAQREVQFRDCLTQDFVPGLQVEEAKAGPASVKYGSITGKVIDIQPILTSVEYHLRLILGYRAVTGIRVV